MKPDARRDATELRSFLARVALRLATASAYQMLARAVVVGTAGLWLAALATLVLPVTLPWGVAGTALAVGLAAAFPLLLWRLRPPLPVAARAADRRLDLADRLGTAVELLGRPESLRGLARLQVSDALDRVRAVSPRAAAPLRIPRDALIAAAAAVSLAGWAQFFAGLTLPATPAARMAVTIHREGSRLIDLGRKIDEAGRARGLPEARRIAPQLADLGRRLSMPRITRPGAVGLLRDTAGRLGAAQDTLDRRLAALLPDRSGSRAHVPATPEEGAQQRERLEAAMREIEALSGRLRSGGPDRNGELAQRLRALSESLDRSGDAPVSSRRDVAASRRDVEQGRLSAAAEALGGALQDLQATARMLEDAQILSEAQRDVQGSSERIAGGEAPGEHASAAGQAGRASPESPSSSEPGSASVPDQEAGTPPPPGPNQGSLPGEGIGGTGGAPAPRLQGTRVPTHLVGIPGEGGAEVQEITASGRAGTPHLPARRPPADVAHEVDLALSREPLPPAYRDIIRRYFEMLGGVP